MGDNYISNLRLVVSDEPDAPPVKQKALSSTFGSSPLTLPWNLPGESSNITVPSGADITAGLDEGYRRLGQVGPSIYIPAAMWQQDDEASPVVLAAVYTFAVPWQYLKATLGSGGGEFGCFYLGVFNSAAAPSVTLTLTDTGGTAWGTTHVFTPSIEAAPVDLSRISLLTTDFFGSWPAYAGLDLTGVSKTLNLKATVTATSPGGVAKAQVSFGHGEIYFSDVPSIKQNAGW